MQREANLDENRRCRRDALGRCAGFRAVASGREQNWRFVPFRRDCRRDAVFRRQSRRWKSETLDVSRSYLKSSLPGFWDSRTAPSGARTFSSGSSPAGRRRPHGAGHVGDHEGGRINWLSSGRYQSERKHPARPTARPGADRSCPARKSGN